MKKIIGSILIIVILLSPACQGQELAGGKPEPAKYTSTTELKYFDFYEYPRIKDASRSKVVSLADLGFSDIDLLSRENFTAPLAEYNLPENASQGPDTWYIINLHFQIDFAQDTGNGFCDVLSGVNNSAGAMVGFETRIVDNSPFIRVHNESSNSTRMDIHYYNYLTNAEVKLGKNVWSTRLRQGKEPQSVKLEKLIIFNDTSIESTNVSPNEYYDKLKIPQVEQDKAKEIALNDPRVQGILAGKQYSASIMRADTGNDIEIKLVFDATYTVDGAPVSALDVFVNLTQGRVTDVIPLSPQGMIQLTEGLKQKVMDIALNDASVQGLIAGKEYRIDRIGPSQGGPAGRLGANMDILFDKTYLFQGDFPSFPGKTDYLNAELTGIQVFVNLGEEKVIQIWPKTAL